MSELADKISLTSWGREYDYVDEDGDPLTIYSATVELGHGVTLHCEYYPPNEQPAGTVGEWETDHIDVESNTHLETRSHGASLVDKIGDSELLRALEEARAREESNDL